MSDLTKKQIAAFLKQLGLPKPKQWEWYEEALTHPSCTRTAGIKQYERLEFLGDAVLKLIISRYLFERFPDYQEGALTQIRSVLVSDDHLAKLAVEIGLADYIQLGDGEKKSGGHQKSSVLACSFEAFLGALYLDGHLKQTITWLENLTAEHATLVDTSATKLNYKAALQEYAQANGLGLPDYKKLSESGPPHQKTFVMSVSLKGKPLGMGQGFSKKEAQQAAAADAWEKINTD